MFQSLPPLANASGSHNYKLTASGEGSLSNYDKEVLKRIEDIEQLDEDTRSKLFFLIDNIIQNFKTKQAFS
ncbi:hypothetical protein [Hyunsoonleella pacifica]|uniref:hypothetical protein n=1 Tax=Hyunsoonleella pacifica TaxID=1080224 RepID=UPI00157FB4F8|nr:hypothetical protein [Hyunsoonleella pacifica]GGD07504.1 hypothetical protein GCM10011368_06800 [Hyunsoonleella pacifica]